MDHLNSEFILRTVRLGSSPIEKYRGDLSTNRCTTRRKTVWTLLYREMFFVFQLMFEVCCTSVCCSVWLCHSPLPPPRAYLASHFCQWYKTSHILTYAVVQLSLWMEIITKWARVPLSPHFSVSVCVPSYRTSYWLEYVIMKHILSDASLVLLV